MNMPRHISFILFFHRIRLRIYLIFGQCIIFTLLPNFVFLKPLMGVNVRTANEGEFPSAVAIKKKHNEGVESENFRICTGTLISMSDVLTAAHCLEVVMLEETEIIVGSVDIREGRKHDPLWWIDCNNWSQAKNIYIRYAVNDIAIIRLSKEVNQSIKPADLSVVPNSFLYELDVMAAGWGVITNGSNSPFLHTVAMTIISNDQCESKIKNSYSFDVEVGERFLCTIAEPFALLCGGDSGGPLYVEDVILGIHKSTAPMAPSINHPDKVNIHTGVVYYNPFILDTLNCNSSDYRI